MGKVGKSSYIFHNVFIVSGASVVGKKEFEGPIGSLFDKHYNDFLIGEKSFEKAEIEMLSEAVRLSISKACITKDEINLIISGDLNNQIVVSSYALRDLDIPYLGIFGACSNATLGIITAAFYIENNGCYVISSTSSHNLTAERTFRYPNEYGTQRANTYTSTVTGASSIVLSNEKTRLKVRRATIGKVVDAEFKDPQDMGRAMAPAYYHTIKSHLLDFNLDINEYDKIITGDLSYYGTKLLYDLFKEDSIDFQSKHEDAGLLIYNREEQDTLAGGSGCGCIGVVLSSYIIDKLMKKEYKKVLVCATGALMNPTMLAQKESIPAICHAISIEVCE